VYSELEFIIHKSSVLGLIDVDDRPLRLVTKTVPAIVLGVLLYYFGFVALVIYSAHRRKKLMSEEPVKQPQSQSSSRFMLRSDLEPEKEDLELEDSEGDGLMLSDDPMFPPDLDEED
jgi:hypothetical protein